MAHIDLARFLKVADQSGDGNDTSYEQAMSQIADAVIKDKAPALVPFELGFQLLDRDEDNNKAFGIKVFKVGKFWLYVPVFLIQGKVKGTEIIYIKNQNLCVPLQDDWIRYIVNKKSINIGNQVERSKHFDSLSTPDFRQISRPPAKYASVAPGMFEEGVKLFETEVLPNWAKELTGDPLQKLAGYDLTNFLEDAGQPALIALEQMTSDCPQIGRDLDRYYGSRIKSAIEKAAQNPGIVRPAPPICYGDLLDPEEKTAALQIITYETILSDDGDLLDDFTEDVPEDVDEDDVKIVDNRDDENISKAVEQDVERRLTNPTESGIYDVLLRPLVYERCAVLIHPQQPDHFRQREATLVRLSDKVFITIHPSKIWVGKEYGDEEWKEFFNSLPDAGKSLEKDDPMSAVDSYDSDRHRDRYVFITPGKDSTAPCSIRKVLGDTDGGKSYEIDVDCCVTDDSPAFPLGSTQNTRRGPKPRMSTDGSLHYPRRILNIGTSRGSKIWSAEQNIYVPEGSKQLVVKHEKHDESILQPGSPTHVTLGLMNKAVPLKLACDRKRVFVNNQGMSRRDAIIHLVRDHGLRKEAALDLLANARDREFTPNPVYTCLIKYADRAAQDYPNAPGYPAFEQSAEPTLYGGQVPGDPSQFSFQSVPDMAAHSDYAQAYDINKPPAQLVQQIQQAAQTGQKEIFDTSMIGAITQASYAGLGIDKYLGRLMSGLDASGWLLMSLYWHNDEFAERYGKEDVGSIENTLRNVFVETGKLILNLKQKGVEDPLDTQQEIDLADDDH